MKLRISQIELRNFKAFSHIVIRPGADFNVIIGENSVGKSTIFEAIQLWEKCYKTYILASRKGFYKSSRLTSRYVNYQDIDFLRITKHEDLFHNPKDADLGKCAEITIALTNDGDDSRTWSLGFKVTCPTSIENAFYRVQPINDEEFSNFAEAFCASDGFLDEAIFIYQTRPVSGVHQFEPYLNEAQIKKKIQKGSSHEVLRNKILSKRRTVDTLESNISDVVGKDVKFRLPAVTRREKDEHIKLEVSIDSGKFYDLHLQGSGFLQIVEILSTIEFVEAPLKLLLVDEPDSHIHTKLQHDLISHLKCIDHNQFFVISHNDQFVTNAGEGEVFFLSQEAKDSGVLEPIDSSSFDVIKNTLGGVIMSLEKLNNTKHIAFVEGKDDADYLKALSCRLQALGIVERSFDDVTFFPLRGKDNLAQKIEYNRRTLATLLKDKTWNAIFDRDFSTSEVDVSLKEIIEGKGCRAHSHEGYCIESVLFSDVEILKRYIFKLYSVIEDDSIDSCIDSLLTDLQNNSTNSSKSLAKDLKVSFEGQKGNRPEFEGLDFFDVTASWMENEMFKVERVMTKKIIRDFVLNVEDEVGFTMFMRRSNNENEVSSILLFRYFDFIESEEDIYPSFKSLLRQLEILEV